MSINGPPFLMGTNTPMEQYRHDTFWTKEPETIAWIESFGPDDVFFDIGANIGVYSLYAGWLKEEKQSHPGLEIYAFEPVEVNYQQLIRNKKDNEFSKWFRTWRCAVGGYSGCCLLQVPKTACGESGAQVVKNTGGTPIWTLDDLLERQYIQQPTHIKIDIDGQELEVLKGAQKTLQTVQSVLVEVSERTKNRCVRLMLDAGLVPFDEINNMIPHSRFRRAAEGIDAENIVFTRRTH